MARKLRTQILIPNQPNHIVVRGNNRRRLFSYPRDYLAYLRLLYWALGENNCLLYGICLMTNHVHLLVEPPTVLAASNAMKRVNQRYAQIHNGKRKGSGKLFEQRFKSEPIKDNDHMRNCALYIDANPFAAHMKERCAYRWSTMGLHLGDGSTDPYLADIIQPSEWYLALGRTNRERAAAYAEHLEEYLVGKRSEKHFERSKRLEPPEFRAARLERPNRSRASDKVARGGLKAKWF